MPRWLLALLLLALALSMVGSALVVLRGTPAPVPPAASRQDGT